MRHASRNRLNLYLMLACLFGSVGLVGCGIKGDLKTPPPLWGDGNAKTGETPNDDSVLSDSPLNRDDGDIFGEDYIDETSSF